MECTTRLDDQLLGNPMIPLMEVAQGRPVDRARLDDVVRRFPFRINGYCMRLLRGPGDPIWRQVMPDVQEIEDLAGWEDPLAEEALSPVPNLVHRYPNRVLWLVSHKCAVHCRFCTRKRRWREPLPLTDENFHQGLDYIEHHHEIKDVLLSGGDPLLLSASRLESILASLRKIPHVEIIRIGSRVPVFFPNGVTNSLARMLARYHPVFVNLHFNHPCEITPQSRNACRLLADAGIPLSSQTVLLKGVNDRPEILGELFQTLLSLRVRPYYLMQMDLTAGTSHFRTRISTGLKIIRALRNHISGMAIPHFVVDLPGGCGKFPLVAASVDDLNPDCMVLRDYRGNRCEYPLLPGEYGELSSILSGPRCNDP